MTNRGHESGMVSWKVFNDLYENQFDAFRKIRFFVKAGKTGKNEPLALDMIEDLLFTREEELERIRCDALQERTGAETPVAITSQALLEGSNNNGASRALVPVGPRENVRVESAWQKLKIRLLGHR